MHASPRPTHVVIAGGGVAAVTLETGKISTSASADHTGDITIDVELPVAATTEPVPAR
jgi:hypothetical protein